MNSKKSTLILSKPLEGKREFIDNYVKNAIKENKTLLFVLTDKNPEQLKKEMLESKIFFKNFYFVDCYSQQNSGAQKDDENIKYVSGPLALNELSIAISEFGRDFMKKEINYEILFDSLSTLLIYSNAEAIARFLQVLVSKVKQLNGGITFTLEEGMHDNKAIITLEHFMDSVINVKKDDKRIFLNVKESGKPESSVELK
jgi:KaiC/GvpD/RAD55 family RecA-like ATPase